MAMALDEVEQEHEKASALEGTAIVESLTRGEIDAQVRTAKMYPRSIRAFRNEAMQMACLDEDTAAECIYALPRGGKPIEGPSARLAEIVASAWGNCRSGARTIAEDDKFVTAQGMFYDVERNYAVAFEVRRRITDKRGVRYNDDMIAVTANAACSIALRNAVFKGVPKAFWRPIYEQARKTAVGDQKTIEARRADLVGYFGKMGVTVDRILAAVGKATMEEIGVDELATLKGVASAIKEGETTIEDAFPPLRPEAVSTGSRAADLADRIKQQQAKPADTGEVASEAQLGAVNGLIDQINEAGGDGFGELAKALGAEVEVGNLTAAQAVEAIAYLTGVAGKKKRA